MSEFKTSNECIESICQQGCTAVRDIIVSIEKHDSVVELEHLDEQQIQQVLTELRIVMSIYDNQE